MKKFDLLLSEAMNVTMMRIFGKSASERIYRSAERHLSLRREEAGEKIGAFYAYLEKLLGPEQARIIHSTSLKCLCLTLKQEYEEIDSYFSLLDELYKTKFKLFTPSCVAERSACNWLIFMFAVVWVGFRKWMSTPNTEFTFTGLKFDDTVTITR